MSAQQWKLDEAREVIKQRNAEILRQNAELRSAAAEIRSLREALAKVRDDMEEWAKLDTARLDWLETIWDCVETREFVLQKGEPFLKLRDGIDYAMAEE